MDSGNAAFLSMIPGVYVQIGLALAIICFSPAPRCMRRQRVRPSGAHVRRTPSSIQPLRPAFRIRAPARAVSRFL